MTLNQHKHLVGKLEMKEYKVSFDMNGNSRHKDGVEFIIEKYKNHARIKIINESI